MSVLLNAIRRNEPFMRWYRGRDITQPRGTLNYDSRRMTATIRRNRAALERIPHWIDEEAFRSSVFEYGVEALARRTLDEPLPLLMNLSDIVVYASSRVAPLRYLELGVSVGKTVWQVMNNARDASLTGYDVEDLNPVLAKMLRLVSTRPVKGASSQLKGKPPHVDEWVHVESGNHVRYLSGDVFDAAMWNTLEGDRFNVIYSDAAHRAEALLFEWERIKALQLLDESGFSMIWDDLASRELRQAFDRIVSDCIAIYGLTPSQACFMHVHGWLGEKEPKHPVGIVSSDGLVA